MCKFNPKNDSRRIDPCIKHLIKELNGIKQKHIEIISCCCGHNKYPLTIIARNKTISYTGLNRCMTWDLVSGIEIPRKKRFYKKDKMGVYYIPECIK